MSDIIPARTIPARTMAAAAWPAESRTRAIVLAVFGSLLLAVSAKVQVPFWPVPMTMQTFVVLVLGAAYGWRLGTAAVLVYLAEGAFGLPVFAGTPEKGIGLAYMAGPTGGYLVGFLLAAALTGWLVEKGFARGWLKLAATMTLGHGVIFLMGVGWLATLIGADKAIAAGLTPFWAATILKTGLAVAVVGGLGRWMQTRTRA